MGSSNYGGVGREQISQEGVFRLSQPTFVNNDYVTAEIIYSTACASHEVPAWSQVTGRGCSCVSFTVRVLAAAEPGLRWSGTVVLLHEVMLWLHHSEVMVMLWLCYSCCISQERGCVLAAVPARRG